MRKLVYIIFIFIFFIGCNELNSPIENEQEQIITESIQSLEKTNFKTNSVLLYSSLDKSKKLVDAFNAGYKSITKIKFRGNIDISENKVVNETKYNIILYGKYQELTNQFISNINNNSTSVYFLPVGIGIKEKNYIRNSRFVNKFEYWSELYSGDTFQLVYRNPGFEFYKAFDAYQYFSTDLIENLNFNEKYIIKYDILEIIGQNPILFWVNKGEVTYTPWPLEIGHYSYKFTYNKNVNQKVHDFALSGYGDEDGHSKTHMIIDNVELCNDINIITNKLDIIPNNLELSGCGTKNNNTEYNITLFDLDPINGNNPEYSNAYIAGKITAISDISNLFKSISITDILTSCYENASNSYNITDKNGYGRINYLKTLIYLIIKK